MKLRNPVPRVLAIHDLSGFGRASLTVVIPVLSTMGQQVCPLPTAVLSTHTGGFSGFRIRDLTDVMSDFVDHWRELELSFDCIYSGFLGSRHQVETVLRCHEELSHEDTLRVVDPVLGDDGRLYPTMDDAMVEVMRELVSRAELITPNFTEAALLLGETPRDGIETSRMKDWLARLCDLGPRVSIVTSVPQDGERDGSAVLAYDRDDGRTWRVDCSYVPAYYPGTGDAFASVVVGSLLQGDGLPLALDRAVQFVTLAIRASFGHARPTREGVLLERVLENLRAPVSACSYRLVP